MTNLFFANTIIATELEFDPEKDAKNAVKHGISLADAMLVYRAPNKLTLETSRNGEDRLMDIAVAEVFGVVLTLVYVIRGQGRRVRAISLRRASNIERRMYEQAIKN